mmetsp:Transcript_30239/g.48845  ORF Transcript_30239/g.48845 Transcript_30239/m.48845 type:complete len:214 (-) Transcript_30239:2231-2872(-)
MDKHPVCVILCVHRLCTKLHAHMAAILLRLSVQSTQRIRPPHQAPLMTFGFLFQYSCQVGWIRWQMAKSKHCSHGLDVYGAVGELFDQQIASRCASALQYAFDNDALKLRSHHTIGMKAVGGAGRDSAHGHIVLMEAVPMQVEVRLAVMLLWEGLVQDQLAWSGLSREDGDRWRWRWRWSWIGGRWKCRDPHCTRQSRGWNCRFLSLCRPAKR